MQRVDSLDTSGNLDLEGSIILVLVLVAFGLLLWALIWNKTRRLKKMHQGSNIKVTEFSQTHESSHPSLKITKPQSVDKGDEGLKTVSTVLDKFASQISPEPARPKYIGYKPLNVFEQSEPLFFPYVIMPKENCVIKFPQKGRVGRKGYKEDIFKAYIVKFFKESFQIFDDRFILIKGSNKPFEPDLALIDEKDGINIFLDIEIDEPYEGTNDIINRKVTHYQFADTNRNNAFKNRGWIVVRFAEIQIHQNPEGCCLFVASVLATINPKFKIPPNLISTPKLKEVRQWTKKEAEQMSYEKYREKYLCIERFGVTDETERALVKETSLGEEVEEIVTDDPLVIRVEQDANLGTPNAVDNVIRHAISSALFVSLEFNGVRTLIKPLSLNNGSLEAYCYIKNTVRTFEVNKIINPIIKQKPFTLEEKGPNLGLERVRAIINTAIMFDKFVRMKYTRSSWSVLQFDEKTSSFIANVTEAEESIRTIGKIRRSINELDQLKIQQYNLNEDYITAYCYRREDKRTFKFDRISEIAILDL